MIVTDLYLWFIISLTLSCVMLFDTRGLFDIRVCMNVFERLPELSPLYVFGFSKLRNSVFLGLSCES